MTSISVTSIKNWILQDPLLDYLNIYGDPMEKDIYEFEEFKKLKPVFYNNIN